jgi:vitamin B12 transporter
MNKKNVLGMLLFCISSYGLAQQQIDSVKVEQLDEVVVTDSRFAIKKENSGKTIIKINAKELEQRQGQTIAQIINTKSGITINGSLSNAGQNLSTYVRGGQNRQVLVLIDGIAVSDPSQIENNFDLQLLAFDQIESIEILKGASSALYGNRASTAVINVTLKKPTESKIKVNMSSFIATNNSQEDSAIDFADFTNSVGFNGTLNRFNYLVNFSNTFTDGLSAIAPVEGAPDNNSDQFSKITGNIKLGYNLSKQFKISLYGNFDKYKTGFDDGFFVSDADNTLRSEQFRLGVAPKYTYKNGSININAAINSVKRDFESSFPTKFEAKSIVIDAYNKYKFSNQFYSIIGLNYINTNMDNFSIPFGASDFESTVDSDDANDNSIDPYINLTYLSDYGLNLNTGMRLNNHSEYGSHFIYNINPSYNFKVNNTNLKLLSSYSTAFITPSLYQLFAPGFGNVELQPQKDATIEVGLDFGFSKALNISVIYFNRKQEDFIDYVVTDFVTYEGEYQNLLETSKVNGVEIEFFYNPIKELDFIANYTFTEKKDGVLFRIPKHKLNANFNYSFCESTNASLSFQYNSERTSPFFNDDFTANRILESYSLVNLNVNHELIENRLKVFTGISNLFNTDYEELYHYSTLGRNMRLGLNLSF